MLTRGTVVPGVNIVRVGGAILGLLMLPSLAHAQPVPAATAVVQPGGPPSAILAEFATAWAQITSYTSTVTVFDRAGTQSQNIVLQYSFRRPSSVTTHVDAGPNAGVTIVWDGGTTVAAHRGSGFAALFKKTFSLHDPQVTTLRGSSIDQLSFGAILSHAQGEAGTLTQTSVSELGGTSVDVITLMPAADPAADAGLTREVVELSTSTHLPVQVLGYDGTTLVRQIYFSNVNPAK